MSNLSSIREDLAVSMTMAAFSGIAWYVAIELNVRLFILFRRRRGLYFWSCVLGSWGVFTQPLFIILADFEVVRNLWLIIVLIYLSWWLMVVPQSFVLYSRLHLIMHDTGRLRWVLGVLIFTTVFISIPTIVIGTLAQASSKSAALTPVNMVWDRMQLTVFFVQETAISILYVIQTRKYLKNFNLADHEDAASRKVMKHLIYSNLVVIFLDITLLAIEYANFFYVQAAYKPCVYGVKLRIEFAILNRLIKSVQHSPHLSYSGESAWPQNPKPHDTPISDMSRAQVIGGIPLDSKNPSPGASSIDDKGVEEAKIIVEALPGNRPAGPLDC